MKKYVLFVCTIFLILSICSLSVANPLLTKGKKPKGEKETFKKNTTYLLLRTDDIGMSHAVDMGLKRLLKTGIPISVSVMWPCPWYQEAVKILKKHPNVSVGVHLTLNSEWSIYRWGPISGRSAVPSLVDTNGYFFHSTKAFYDNHPKMSEVRKELRAQIERAIHSGLKIDYVDYHMLTACDNPQILRIVEQLAKQYHLGMAEFFGEKYEHTQYAAPVNAKTDSLVNEVMNLKPGLNAINTHVAIDNPEIKAMKDASGGLRDVGANRQAVLNALTSPKFKEALQEKHVKLVTYRDLVKMIGLKNMHPPKDGFHG